MSCASSVVPAKVKEKNSRKIKQLETVSSKEDLNRFMLKDFLVLHLKCMEKKNPFKMKTVSIRKENPYFP